MFQYRMFLLKEWKQLRRNKKVILYCLLFTFFAPVMNYLATGSNPITGNPLLPLEMCIPFFVIVSGLIPCELTGDIMNDEFHTKSYEILAISKINKRLIIFSKITIPSLLGIIVSLVSILINNSLPYLTGKDVFSHFGDSLYYLFLVLSVVYASLLFILLIEGKQKHISKQMLTFFAGVVMYGSILPIYILYYFGLRWLAILILMIASGIVYYLSLIGLHHLQPKIKVKKKYKLKFTIMKYRFFILCKQAYCHYWNWRKAVLFIFALIIVAVSCQSYINEPVFIILFSVLPVAQYLLIDNHIIVNSTLLEKRINGFLHMKLAKVSSIEFICSRVLYPFIFNIMLTIIFQAVVLQNILELYAVLNYLSMNLLVCLLTLFLSLLVKESAYLGQDKLIVLIGVTTLSAIFINLKFVFIFITLINLILYFLCSHHYQKI